MNRENPAVSVQKLLLSWWWWLWWVVGFEWYAANLYRIPVVPLRLTAQRQGLGDLGLCRRARPPESLSNSNNQQTVTRKHSPGARARCTLVLSESRSLVRKTSRSFVNWCSYVFVFVPSARALAVPLELQSGPHCVPVLPFLFLSDI